MNLHSMDLNLLVALEALLAEAHISNAARRVGLTQPAMSNALARLRITLNDPLLVRAARGMNLTPRAQELVEPVRQALASLDHALFARPPFEPTTAKERFIMAATDLCQPILLPPLIQTLANEAPGIGLAVRPSTALVPYDELTDGRVDLATGIVHQDYAGLYHTRLYKDRWVSLVRQGHPTIKKSLSMEQFTKVGHLLVSPFGQEAFRGLLDERMAKLGLEREVQIALPQFLMAPVVVAQTDHLVTLPERIARYAANLWPLQLLETPLELPTFAVSLIWQSRTHADPAHQWLRQKIVSNAKKIV